MRQLSRFAYFLLAAFLFSGCSLSEDQTSGIHLPAGDAAKGEALFASVGCVGCHAVGNADFGGAASEGAIQIRLGSKTGQRMSYDQLVTSIVNPSHRLAPHYFGENIAEDKQSRMANFNDTLTVTQLTDLVAYLQTQYQDVLRPGYQYPSYRYIENVDAVD